MAIVAMIMNSQCEEEKNFSIPIATQQMYNDVWEKTITKLELPLWGKLTYDMFDFTKEELPQVLEELDQINQYFQQSAFLDKATKLFLSERVALIKDRLIAVLDFRDDVIVSIF